jgi:S1-C subfamily serine protease
VIGRDRTRDLALRGVPRHVWLPVSPAHRLPDVCESVAALGYPWAPAHGDRGTVSGLNRTILINGVRRKGLIQTDAAVNRGNSGGPLVSIETGEVIGLVDLRAADASGIAFAVNTKTAAPLLERWSKSPKPVAAARCSDLRSVSPWRGCRLYGWRNGRRSLPGSTDVGERPAVR